MPLLRIPRWPSLARVAAEGCAVVDAADPVWRVGLLNMMPDRAVAATERQFLRLLSVHAQRACLVQPFHLSDLPGGAELERQRRDHSREHARIPEFRPDALVVTGANVTQPELRSEPFWDGLAGVLQWADEHRIPTLCSCLAAHASARLFHGIARRHLPRKCWGVYAHRVCAPGHPLMRGVPAEFDMPHSRFNDISAAALQACGVQVLAVSAAAGVQAAAEPDLRRVYFQGHPEYEAVSLLKEYKREVLRFFAGERDYPPLPERTFSADAQRAAGEFRAGARAGSLAAEAFPESRLQAGCRAPWRGIAETLYRNWLAGLPDGPSSPA